MLRELGFGLRTQILLALSAVFAAAFVLLTLATSQLAQRSRAAEREREMREDARLIATALAEAGPGAFDGLARATLAQGSIVGVEWTPASGGTLRRGRLPGRAIVEAEVPGAGTLRLHHGAAPSGANAPFVGLVLLYAVVTGFAVLLLAYVTLTVLIVRPVEALTRASERLAGGRLDTSVPATGAAEVARLAMAFNRMAEQLREDRHALESRLREVERTKAELESAQEQVIRGEKLASVGRVAAGVAHEIGNPLAAILGLIELVRSGDLEPEEAREFLGRIQAETERIHEIIRELLAFARQGDPRAEGVGTLGAVDLRAVVEDAVRLVAPRKALGGSTIAVSFAEDLPRVTGNAERLGQVVLNLLLNAADAQAGKGRIGIEVAPVPGRGEVALRVVDQGPGIDAAVAEHLFEPFVTTKPPGQGTGLGLAVCHTLIARMGGTITGSNRPEGGAVFEVRLAAADTEQGT